VSYIAGAFGACVAALYYVVNLREAAVNKKKQLSTAVTEKLGTRFQDPVPQVPFLASLFELPRIFEGFRMNAAPPRGKKNNPQSH